MAERPFRPQMRTRGRAKSKGTRARLWIQTTTSPESCGTTSRRTPRWTRTSFRMWRSISAWLVRMWDRKLMVGYGISLKGHRADFDSSCFRDDWCGISGGHQKSNGEAGPHRRHFWMRADEQGRRGGLLSGYGGTSGGLLLCWVCFPCFLAGCHTLSSISTLYYDSSWWTCILP